jgi:hypothetical protein
LLHGIRSLLRCDEAEVVAGLVDYMYAQYGILRFLSRLVERTRRTLIPPAITLLGALKSFLYVRDPAPGGRAVWVARLANERRVIEPFISLLPELEWREVRLDWRFNARDVLRLASTFAITLRRIIRLSRRLHLRHPGFKVLRVAELLGFYMRYRRVLVRERYSLAVMSSHSNPHGIAFNIAARSAGIPVVLITHGMPVRPVANLSFDLAIVHCHDAVGAYEDGGCQLGRVLVHGRRQHQAAMPDGPLPARIVVGIFLCKDVNESRLRTLVQRLRADERVARILVRPHPFNMWAGLARWIAECADERISLSTGRDVFQDIVASDVVLAGNSSVHIEAVLAGRPSAYVPGFDHATPDMHRLVANGLIPSIGDDLRFDPEAMLQFYRRAEWPGILQRFANVNESEAEVAANAAGVMRRLALQRLDA